MIAIPALDLRQGACVQLVGGSYDHERIRLPDPVRVADQWAAAGFEYLHVVDLDAATGRGSNRALVLELVARGGMRTQVGGGVRSTEDIRMLLGAGAGRVVVGTRALTDRLWLVRAAAAWPDRLIVAADVRGRAVLTHGWTRTIPGDLLSLLESLDELPIAGVLITAVHCEGREAGADLTLLAEAAAATRHRVFAAGGIASRAGLAALERAGCFGAVLGMALYTGALAPATVAREFAS
jgi:phosphoribosylformimino-5-aminoimidazole carboxamide ribotide isomerase